MDREKKAADCKVDSIGSGRAIPIKQVSSPFPCGQRAVEVRDEAQETLEGGALQRLWGLVTVRPALPLPGLNPQRESGSPAEGKPPGKRGYRVGARPCPPHHHRGAAESHLPSSAAGPRGLALLEPGDLAHLSQSQKRNSQKGTLGGLVLPWVHWCSSVHTSLCSLVKEELSWAAPSWPPFFF